MRSRYMIHVFFVTTLWYILGSSNYTVYTCVDKLSFIFVPFAYPVHLITEYKLHMYNPARGTPL